jgi:N-hydroxyarylamine O-acetyltransferase
MDSTVEHATAAASVGFDVVRYLRRIDYAGSRAPTLDTLIALQLAHLVSVPFENLHVFRRRGVRVDLEWSYAKVVEQRRGGWCFELNGCFSELLRRLGYSVDLLSGRVYQPSSGGLSPEFDHLALLVHTAEGPHLVDVGWGDSVLQPLPAEAGEYDTRPRPARVEADRGSLRVVELVTREDGETVWELQYEADRRPRLLAEFDPRSRFLQTEPGLSWTEKPLVTRATSANGARVTLHADRLRVRDDDLSVVDRPVRADTWTDVLLEHFGLDLP